MRISHFHFREEILTLVPAGLSPTIHVLDQIKVIDRFRGRVKRPWKDGMITYIAS